MIAEGKKTAQQHAENPKVLLDGPRPATEAEKAANCAVGTNERGHSSNSADYLTDRIARPCRVTIGTPFAALNL